MTANSKDARDALRRLADSLAEDVLNAQDREVLEDAIEAYGDPETLAADMRKLFERTANEKGKARLMMARAAVAADRQRSFKPAAIGGRDARQLWEQVLASDPETARRITIAARKGEEPSDDDIRSMLEDFEELGLLPPRSGNESK